MLTGVFAMAETIVSGGLKFETNADGTCTLTGYFTNAPTGELSIPATVNAGEAEYEVTAVGDRAFSGCYRLTSLIVPASVLKIGNDAFDECPLSEIKFEDSDSPISLGTQTVNGSSTGLFYGSTLTSLYIGRNVDSGYSPFRQSIIRELTIGEGMSRIPESMFLNCFDLLTIKVLRATPPTLSSNSFNTTAYNNALVEVPASAVAQYKRVWTGFKYIMGDDTEQQSRTIDVLRPGGLEGVISSDFVANVTTLKLRGYINGSDIATLNSSFPSVRSLDLSEVSIFSGGDAYYSKDGVSYTTAANTLGGYWSYGMALLESVELPSDLKAIGDYAFAEKLRIRAVELPRSVQSIGAYAFTGCNALESVELGTGITAIGEGAFNKCRNLQEISLPSGVTEIAGKVFAECASLKSVTIGRGVTSIGDNAFSQCSSLGSVALPSSLTSIGKSAFYQCVKLNEMMLPTRLKTIGASAFSGCASLTWLSIPASVTEIGQQAFKSCGNLRDVKIISSAEPLQFGASVFDGSNVLETLDLGRDITYPGNNSPFRDQDKLASLTIGQNVTSIGNSAFAGCSSLRSVTIPAGVTAIDDYAFSECPALRVLQIDDCDEPLAFGMQVFGKDISRSLYSVTIGRNLTYSNDYPPFLLQTELRIATLGEKVTSVGDYLFAGCWALSQVFLPSTITRMSVAF